MSKTPSDFVKGISANFSFAPTEVWGQSEEWAVIATVYFFTLGNIHYCMFDLLKVTV